MKKILAFVLVLAMVFAMAGCGNSDKPEKPETEEETQVSEEETTTDEAITEDALDENIEVGTEVGTGNVTQGTKPNSKPPAGNSTGGSTNSYSNSNSGNTSTNTGSTASGTTGATLLKDFQNRIAKNPAITPQDMASAILGNSIIGFKGSTAAVQPGMLTGFSSEIKGFDNGVMFAPMIGSIPFMGYIFTVPADGDVKVFTDALKNNANPRWNVCTEADETVVQSSGNTVFFLMCPKSLEE